MKKTGRLDLLSLLVILLAVPCLIASCRGRTILDSKSEGKHVVGHLASAAAGGAPQAPVAGDFTVKVWFVRAEKDNLVYVSQDRNSHRVFPMTSMAIIFAMNELLAGPKKESFGDGAAVSSEIPAATKLLRVDDDENKGVITIDLSSAFVEGGGNDSFEARLEQVRRTVSGIGLGIHRPIYLDIEGKRLTASGEGLEVKQPINDVEPVNQPVTQPVN